MGGEDSQAEEDEMMAVDLGFTQSNGSVYPDEVALINMFRRIRRGLTTGYGEIQFTVKVVDHCGESIEAVVEDRAIVDEDAPVVIGTICQFPGNAT